MGCGGGERTILSLSAEDVWTVLEEEIRSTFFHRLAGYFLSDRSDRQQLHDVLLDKKKYILFLTSTGFSTVGKNSLNLVQILSFYIFLFLFTFLLYFCTYVAVLLFKRDKLTTFIRVDSFH